MQDQGGGDVGDFGKCGILRALSGWHPHDAPGLRLGVIWYFVGGKEKPGENRRPYEYLRSKGPLARSLRECDQDLARMLQVFRRPRAGSVKAIVGSGILSPETKFYDAPLEKGGR